MENLNKIKEQAILLFVAVEEEKVIKTNEITPDYYKQLNEVNEFTEIWELVKK